MPLNTEPLGELETTVMNIVWKSAPLTARQVCERLHGKRERAYTTIMTTMDRLHRKGLLRREKDGLAWLYEPTLDARDYFRSVAEGLAGRILSGDRETGLSAFVDATARMDRSLLEKLRLLIEQKRGQRP